MKNTLATLTLVLASTCAWGQPALAATLKKPFIDQLMANPQAHRAPDFPAFLAVAALADPSLAPAVAAYQSQRALAGDDLTNIARLLGAYGRLRNQQPVIDALEKMVALPTVRTGNVPQHESPAILEFGRLVETMARDFGLGYRNVDNRIFEVTL